MEINFIGKIIKIDTEQDINGVIEEFYLYVLQQYDNYRTQTIFFSTSGQDQLNTFKRYKQKQLENSNIYDAVIYQYTDADTNLQFILEDEFSDINTKYQNLRKFIGISLQHNRHEYTQIDFDTNDIPDIITKIKDQYISILQFNNNYLLNYNNQVSSLYNFFNNANCIPNLKIYSIEYIPYIYSVKQITYNYLQIKNYSQNYYTFEYSLQLPIQSGA